MNTKKAVEFLEGHKVDYNNKIGYQGRIEHCKDNNIIKMYDEVIALLKRGEVYSKESKITKEELKKVWQMWKELEFECREIHASPRAFQTIKHWMKDIKQKYFPKDKIGKE